MIIALTGYKRSGKDTVGAMVSKLLCLPTYSLAGPLKEAVRTLFKWTEEHTDGFLKETIDPDYGVTPRSMMQYVGTELMQYNIPAAFPLFEETIGRTFWCQRLSEDMKGSGVITDVRFPHEVDFFRERGETVIVIRISRNNCYGDSHASEREIDNILPDYIILNNGTLNELFENVQNVLNDIKAKQLEGVIN